MMISSRYKLAENFFEMVEVYAAECGAWRMSSVSVYPYNTEIQYKLWSSNGEEVTIKDWSSITKILLFI